MRILHIIKSLGRGGAETLLPETLRLHNQSEFEFHYVYFLPWKNQLVESITSKGGRVTCLKAKNNFFILFTIGKLIRYVRTNQIQLIHCHLPWAGIAGRIVHQLTGIPVIYTEHNKQERYHYLTRWMNRLTFNWQNMAIAVSEDVAISINKNIKPRIPIKLILNGVNTDFFVREHSSQNTLRTQYNIAQDAVVVGTIAVFRFQKRLKEWLEVFAASATLHPNMVGVIVGDGPLKDEILQQRKQLQLENKVHMVGLQTDVKPWLNIIDIFMMTSQFEGLPIALLEAMSMECAIITTDAGGIKEVISDVNHGRMVSVDNWVNLSTHLNELVVDPQLRSQLSLAARKRVVDAFGILRMVQELEKLYRSKIN